MSIQPLLMEPECCLLAAAQLTANDLCLSCVSQVTEYLNSQESAKSARVSPSSAITRLLTHRLSFLPTQEEVSAGAQAPAPSA